ncbi:lysine N(6)-hydroxylase/L-ornithine N(5)-oxygenase family protein [Ideonella sp.]|uniref:lysine N(6)-hydroxylase/L-ornithine N(5)-oxygenase family protein n=1 Tax=Ideonella sp. TaxID=1929293 RepID=UPI0035B20268
MQTEPVHDVIAVGLGPFNLGLACLLEPLGQYRCLFLERQPEFNWHPGLMLPEATLQNPFLADLVTLADPTSRFSYLNHCKQDGRLYRRFIREQYTLTRREYNRYCQWACAQLKSVRFGSEVRQIEHDAASGHYVVSGLGNDGEFAHHARKLVLGIGTTPSYPACCEPHQALIHSSNYLQHKRRLQARRSITVIGSGQSGAEIVHDLLREQPQHGYALQWITRSPRFFPMEYAKLTTELSSPDYARHFQRLPMAARQRLLRGQRPITNGINAQLINAIYDLLEEQAQEAGLRTFLLPGCELQSCRFEPESAEYELRFWHTDLQRHYLHRTDGLIFATGYAHRVPAFIDGLRGRLHMDEHGRYEQAPNHSVDVTGRDVFVQNAGFHALGLTSPDLGMSCLRNAALVKELTGVDHYPVEERIALQHFEPPAGGPLQRVREEPKAIGEVLA